MPLKKSRLEQVTEAASKAFWAKVQEELPDLNPDHLDVGTILTLQWQMEAGIKRYVEACDEAEDVVPPPPTGLRRRGRQF